VLLALPPDDLERRYPEAEGVDLPRLRRELALVRRRGFAINDGLTETGLTAIGVAVPWPDEGAPAAAISLAMPSARFDHDRLPFWRPHPGRHGHGPGAVQGPAMTRPLTMRRSSGRCRRGRP
jgi:DNA-binding IclR family transcriptional regulator